MCDVSCLASCWSRASDKKRNLAQQKAEAQRRLYGHGSMKKLSAASSDWEKQRHTLERRREELVRTSRKKEKAGGEQKSTHLKLFFKFTNTGLYIRSVTHTVPPERRVKPQLSKALAGIKLWAASAMLSTCTRWCSLTVVEGVESGTHSFPHPDIQNRPGD